MSLTDEEKTAYKHMIEELEDSTSKLEDAYNAGEDKVNAVLSDIGRAVVSYNESRDRVERWLDKLSNRINEMAAEEISSDEEKLLARWQRLVRNVRMHAIGEENFVSGGIKICGSTPDIERLYTLTLDHRTLILCDLCSGDIRPDTGYTLTSPARQGSPAPQKTVHLCTRHCLAKWLEREKERP